MANSNKEIIFDDGRIVQISVSDCESSVVNVYTCPHCSGDDSGDDSGDNNDDDKNGEVNLTVFGGEKMDYFNHVAKCDDGFIAVGEGTGAPLMAAKFSKDLKLLSQTGYSLGEGSENLILGRGYSNSFVFARNKKDYVVGVSGYSFQYGNAAGALLIDGQSRDSLKSFMSELAISPMGSLTTTDIISMSLTPKKFTGSAEFIAVGCYESKGLIVTFDKDMNALSQKTMTLGSCSKLNDIYVSESSSIAVGYTEESFFTLTKKGIIICFDDIQNATKAFTVSCDNKITLNSIKKTDYGYLIVGHLISNSEDNILLGDVLLLAFDEDFKLIRHTVVGSRGSEVVSSVDMNSNGEILLCGLTNCAGLGGSSVFAMRFDSAFNLTKQLTFGGTEDEFLPYGIFNNDGSITVVGGTPNAGAGEGDAFIVTFSGNWKDLTGSVKKYPQLAIDGKPGFEVLNKDINMSINETIEERYDSISLGTSTTNYITNKSLNLAVDANATI